MAYSTINKSTLYQNTVLYTGTGSTQSITGIGFEPSLVWCKVRNNTDNHVLFDAVRGATKRVESNNTAAEVTATDELTAFNSDGFSTGSADRTNRNLDTYASWNWKANGAGSANTDGSISSTVSANTTSGFSIVSYTGTGSNATVGHGLGVAPAMFIIKNRTSSSNTWTVYNKNLADATKFLGLNTTAAVDTSAANFNSTAPTSSVFSVGTDAGTNGSTTMIAYCFAEISGYSKFGIYTGNGASTSDGSFIYTGFKPTFVMVKRSNGAKNWHIFDTTRSTSNLTKADLKPNSNVVEDTTNDWLDILSNGFKWRIASGDVDYSDVNGDGDNYFYMAFAEAPFVNSNGVPCNAR